MKIAVSGNPEVLNLQNFLPRWLLVTITPLKLSNRLSALSFDILQNSSQTPETKKSGCGCSKSTCLGFGGLEGDLLDLHGQLCPLRLCQADTLYTLYTRYTCYTHYAPYIQAIYTIHAIHYVHALYKVYTQYTLYTLYTLFLGFM